MGDTPKTPQSDQTKQNETMQREQQRSEFDKNRKPEEGKAGEKSAIGGSETPQTGEPGRARSELDKNKSEPTSR